MKNLFKALLCLTVVCSLPACKYFSKETTQPVEVHTTTVEEIEHAAPATIEEALVNTEVTKEVA